MEPLAWFDIPVTDLDRAIRFYTALLGVPVRKEQFPGLAVGILPRESHEVGGCLVPVAAGENKPSAFGPLLYINAQGRLEQAAAAAEAGGGKILQPKHPIGSYGFRVVILDSEGNRLALHST